MNENDNKILLDISERLVRVETKIDAMSDIKDTAEKANTTANQALALSNNNKERLDKIDKITFWAGTTIIGAVLLSLLGVIFI